MMVRLASLFSGIGGFEKGFLQADPNTEIVFASEIDKYARQIYHKNFGVEPYGDITKIKASNIPDHDILCAGFPCQSFSIAGTRRGFEDTRGTLFFEVVRIAKTKRPKLLLLENVRGLLNHDSGRTFLTILRSLDDMGYDAEWQVFNSKNHGVPQNRERVFIIGHFRGAGTRAIFPITEGSGMVEPEKSTVYCLDANYYKGPAQQARTMIMQLNNPAHSQDRIYDPNGISPSLNCAEGGNRQPFIEIKPIMLANKKMNGRRIKEHNEDSFTLDCCNSSGVVISYKDDTFKLFSDGTRLEKDYDTKEWIDTTQSQIRRLTPIECERLQGFPDGWTGQGTEYKYNVHCVR